MDFTVRMWTRALELKRVMSGGADVDPPSDDEVIAVIAPMLASLFSTSYLERRLHLSVEATGEVVPKEAEPAPFQILLDVMRTIVRMRHRSLIETARFLGDVGKERAQLVLTTNKDGDVEALFSYLGRMEDATAN